MKVSAIITTYNSEKYIRRTINSILNQENVTKDFELEIIVIDDNSNDNTCQIIREEYKTVLFVQNTINSGGPNKGRNIGMNMATGDYICIVDHDDEWLPNKISEQLKYVNSENKIVTSSYILINVQRNSEEKRGNKSVKRYTCYSKNETFINKLSKSKSGEKAYIGSIMFHKSLVTHFEEEYGMVDFDWLLHLFENNCSTEVNVPLYRRYFDGSNLSLNEKYRENDFFISLQILETYKDKYPEIISKSVKRLNGSLARYYYVVGKMNLSRQYFMKSELNLRTIAYMLTTFVGSKLVKRYFNVFG